MSNPTPSITAALAAQAAHEAAENTLASLLTKIDSAAHEGFRSLTVEFPLAMEGFIKSHLHNRHFKTFSTVSGQVVTMEVIW